MANQILSTVEINDLVKICKVKNLFWSAEGRQLVGKHVILLLMNRGRINKGRKYKKLNKNEQKTVNNGKVSTALFHGFLNHPEISERRHRTIEKRRYEWGTRVNINKYLADLEGDLRAIDAVEVAENDVVVKVDLDRVITNDECPSVVGQGDRSGAGSKVIGGKGDATNNKKFDNKERISYDPYVTLGGTFVLHHLIIKRKNFDNHVLLDPDNECDLVGNNYFLSLQPKAFQDG